MPSIAALEPNKLFMMSENGVDECFDSKVFLRFHIRALLFVQVFEYCVVINTANAVVERRSKDFRDLWWTVCCKFDYAISGHDEREQRTDR